MIVDGYSGGGGAFLFGESFDVEGEGEVGGSGACFFCLLVVFFPLFGQKLTEVLVVEEVFSSDFLLDFFCQF